MKNQFYFIFIRILFGVLLFVVLPLICKSQTYDVYIANRTITTDTTMEFDVFIKSNDTTGSWPLRTYQAGYQFNSSFVNSGTLRGQYIIGSTDLTEGTFGKTWGFSWNQSNRVLNQSANTGGSCPGALIGPIARKIGRFKVTNSVSWGCSNDEITITTSATQGSGYLRLAVTKWTDSLCFTSSGISIINGATSYTSSPLETTLQAFATGDSTVSCGRTANIIVSATGGLPPYSGTGSFSRGAGNWSFTVTDSRGCSTVTNKTIVSSPDVTPPVIITCPPPQSETANSTEIPNFTVNAVATDNCSPPGILIIGQSPGAGTPVSPGIYPVTITVRDGSNNTTTCITTFTVLAPCSVTAAVSATTGVSCFNGSNGTVTVTISNAGVNPTGTYSLDGAPGISFSGNSFTVTGLTAGNHSINVSTGGCNTSTGSFFINSPFGPLSSSFSASGCNSYLLPWGQTVTASGIYTNVYITSLGCDSTVTANITILRSTNNSSSDTACDNQLPYLWNGSSFTIAGVYTFSYINGAGCQSTDTLYLTVANGNYWKGTISDQWENPANWGCGQVPDSSSIVFIQPPAPFYPIVRSQAACKKITVGATATLRVATGFRLSVTGTD